MDAHFSIHGETVLVPSQLDTEGWLEDVENNLIAKGLHSGSSCAKCNEELDGYELFPGNTKAESDEEEPENCLVGWRCPECGKSRQFKILSATITTDILLSDDGTEEVGEHQTDWEPDAHCVCDDCGYEGSALDFQVEHQRRAPSPLVLTRQEATMVLVGLRCVQAMYMTKDDALNCKVLRHHFAEHFGEVAPMGNEGVDALCERINCDSATPTKLWVSLWHHKHGIDVFPALQDTEPDSDALIARLRASGEWDGDDDEAYREGTSYIEHRGPFGRAIPCEDVDE